MRTVSRCRVSRCRLGLKSHCCPYRVISEGSGPERLRHFGTGPARGQLQEEGSWQGSGSGSEEPKAVSQAEFSNQVVQSSCEKQGQNDMCQSPFCRDRAQALCAQSSQRQGWEALESRQLDIVPVLTKTKGALHWPAW